MKKVAAYLVLLLGLSGCAHLGRPSNREVRFPVFNYHHVGPIPSNATAERICFTVTPEVFRQQLQYFRDHDYAIVPLDVLLDCFDHGAPIPAKAVALTFDDGWEDQYRWAFPALKEFGVTGTFFIPVGWVGHPRVMTWSQICEMHEAGMTIGTHGSKHYHFDEITKEYLRKEIVDSKKKMEEHLGVRVDFIAYPGGHWTPQAVKFVRSAGYRAAMGVDHNIVQSPAHRFDVRRFHADNNLESIIQPLRDAGY